MPFSRKPAGKANKIFAKLLYFAMAGYRFHREQASVGFATAAYSVLYRVDNLPVYAITFSQSQPRISHRCQTQLSK